MATVNTALQKKNNEETKTIGTYLNNVNIKASLSRSLSSEKEVQKFISSVCSAVAVNPALQKCDFSTVVSSALLANSLNLSLSPNLGFCYLVPFEDRKNGRTVATFVPGYKAYIQLAIRSGYYKKLNVIAVKEGELIHYDPLNEELEVTLIADEDEREAAPTIGYYAMFEHVNGFRKALYWSKAKMEIHALKYSKGYMADKKNGTAYTFWAKDFDAMAYKTMIRQLISKWGIMSIDMQKAYESENDYSDDVKTEIVSNTQRPIEENLQDIADETSTENIDVETGEVIAEEEQFDFFG